MTSNLLNVIRSNPFIKIYSRTLSSVIQNYQMQTTMLAVKSLPCCFCCQYIKNHRGMWQRTEHPSLERSTSEVGQQLAMIGDAINDRYTSKMNKILCKRSSSGFLSHVWSIVKKLVWYPRSVLDIAHLSLILCFGQRLLITVVQNGILEMMSRLIEMVRSEDCSRDEDIEQRLGSNQHNHFSLDMSSAEVDDTLEDVCVDTTSPLAVPVHSYRSSRSHDASSSTTPWSWQKNNIH